MRKLFTLTAIVAVVLITASTKARADSYAFGFSVFTATNDLVINGKTDIDNTDSGWIGVNGVHIAGNTNYYSGNDPVGGGGADANYFSFTLPKLKSVTTASFDVYTYTIDSTGWYTFYYSSLKPSDVPSSSGFTQPGYYDAIVNGPVIATVWLTPADSNEILVIDLNAIGDAILLAKSSKSSTDHIVLGGEFAPVPEPSTYLMFGAGLLGLAFLMRKKIAQQVSGLSSASQMGTLA